MLNVGCLSVKLTKISNQEVTYEAWLRNVYLPGSFICTTRIALIVTIHIFLRVSGNHCPLSGSSISNTHTLSLPHYFPPMHMMRLFSTPLVSLTTFSYSANIVILSYTLALLKDREKQRDEHLKKQINLFISILRLFKDLALANALYASLPPMQKP